MRSNFLSLLAGFALGLILMFFLLPDLLKKSLKAPFRKHQIVEITSIKTVRDTILIPHFVQRTVVMRIPVPITVDSTLLDTLRMDSYARRRYAGNFTRRLYKDSTSVAKNVQIGYTADVTGTLNSMTIGYRDSNPKLILHDSVTIEKTIIKSSNGVYLGLSASNQRWLGPSLQVTKNQNTYGISANALDMGSGKLPGINLSFHRKLF